MSPCKNTSVHDLYSPSFGIFSRKCWLAKNYNFKIMFIFHMRQDCWNQQTAENQKPKLYLYRLEF